MTFVPHELEILGFEKRSELALPLYLATVSAGFPSPAEDYIDKRLDLNEHLVRHPEATFFVRVQGHSMADAGIAPGDILVVDRAATAVSGSIVIAAVDGELTVKRLRTSRGRVILAPENPDYAPTEVGPEQSFEVWGVVTYIIHKAVPRP
ncbi:MAG: translesion error-prone DNA polymerase V autoproteolytic subunit [Desulfovibrionaceae bacterium]|nr:translesion error-prone DNA polymerase V autoproteolytic subunit [Desulfovibrionaceae bacterium]